MSADRKSFWRDESGSSMIEFTVAMTGFFLILFGIIEFSYVFYQWNAATKAVQFGARLAAVSDPVASALTTLTGMEGGALPGDAMPNFNYVCTAASSTCNVDGGDGGVRDLTALNTLVYGRGNGTNCIGTGANIGMCNIFSGILPANVKIRYQYTGLGYAGRPGSTPARAGGPVPTITVSVIGLSYNYFFLSGLMNLTSVTMPPLATTVTGEDLNVN